MNTEEIIEKAVKPEVSKETLLEVIKELQEIVVGILEIEEEDGEETESPELEVTPSNPSPIGNPEENNINWPVAKVEGQLLISEEERAILEQDKLAEESTTKKSLWNNMFDPNSFNKRTF